MPELSIELRAKFKQLEDDLDEIKDLLTDVGDEADDASDKIENAGKKTAKSSKVSTTAMKNLGKEVIDVAKGSSTLAGSLKKVATTLAGAGGLGFAATVVIEILGFLIDRYLQTADATTRVAEATANLIGKANSEINTLRTLIGIVEDKNNVDKVRLAALDEINTKYSKYLGNLDLENIKTTDVKESVDALTKSLIRQAQVRGIESAITKVYEEAGEELTKLLLQQRAAAKEVKREVDELVQVDAFSRIDRTKPLTDQIKQITDIVNRNKGAGQGLLAGLGISVNDFNNAIAETREFKSDLQKELAPLQELFNDFSVQNFFDKVFELEGVTLSPLKGKIDKFKNDFRNLDDIFGITEAVQRSLDSGEGTFQAVEIRFDRVGNSIAGALDIGPSKVKPALSKIEELLLEFSENADNIIKDNISSAFRGIGEAIGTALSDSTSIGEALGKSLLSSIGGVLIQLGELAISTGVGILAINTALKSLNPYVAIAAGVALIALGSAVSNSAANIGSSSPTTGSSTVAGQGTSNTSFSGGSNSPLSSTTGGEFIFRIRGQELIGVIENTLTANQRLGGITSISG